MNYPKRFAILAIFPSLILSPLAVASNMAPSNELEKISYSLGVKTAENFNAQQIKINPVQFNKGLNDVLNKEKLSMSEEEIQKVLTKFQQDQIALLTKREKQIAAVNLAKSKAFFETNKKKPGVKTLASGLQYIELKAGSGASPKASDFVKVNYRGTLLDGTEFDSSYNRKEANTFQIEGLIPGWQEALLLMKPGAKWKIFVPPQLAYGTKGAGQVIEPNSALIFEIELLDIQPNG